jgi:hypothetical protein
VRIIYHNTDADGTHARLAVLQSHTPPRIVLTLRDATGRSVSIDLPEPEVVTMRKAVAVVTAAHRQEAV